MAKGDLWVAVQPGSIGIGEGDYVMLNVGDVAEDGHPVMAGREAMFARMPIRFVLGDGQAEVQAAKPEARTESPRGSQVAQEPPAPVTPAEGKASAGKAGSGSGGTGVGLTSADAPGASRKR